MSDEHRYSDETLRAYAKGRLPAAEAAALEADARANPRLAAELALARGVVKAGETDPRRTASLELGWARLSKAIDAEAGGRPLVPKQFSRWQVVAAAAAAVAVWTVLGVPFLTRSPPPTDNYVMASERPAYAYSAQATFVPTAPESAIREALRSAGAEIVKGPSALGVYVLAFKDAGSLKSGVEALRAKTGVFESLQAN